jgi:hypothetical protein
MRWLCLLLCIVVPATVSAKINDPEEYGVGLLCPRADTQVSFYTESNQQDAAGTIAYENGAGFAVASDTVKNLESGGAHLIKSLCPDNMPGIRIESKRDGWLQAGELWLPPNQEWDYGDWQDYLRKTAIWKPLVSFTLYQGSGDAPYKDKPYADSGNDEKFEVYPLKFTDDYALVLLDRSGAFAKNCAGTPAPPTGKLGWVHIGIAGDGSKPEFVPAHTSGCP